MKGSELRSHSKLWRHLGRNSQSTLASEKPGISVIRGGWTVPAYILCLNEEYVARDTGWRFVHFAVHPKRTISTANICDVL